VLCVKPEQKKLVEQIITYADAITAFSFVQSTAFGFALAGHEFRESMLKIPHHWVWGVLVAYFIYIAFVVALWWCYRIDLSATKEEMQSKDYRVARALWWGRIGVIILAGLLSALALGFTINGASAPGGSMTVTINL
jgi:hypothetical protein